jgi:hypothetical protein
MPNIRLKRYNGAAWENVEVQTDWSQILNKPSTFTPTSHTHSGNDITSGKIDPQRLGSGQRTATTFLNGLGNWETVESGGGDADTLDGYHASGLWRSDGGAWNPGANITLGQTANGQEWSFDISRNGFTGGYWHVWDSVHGTILAVNPTLNSVGIGTATPGGILDVLGSGTHIFKIRHNAVNGGNWGINPYISGISNAGLSFMDVRNGTTPMVISDGGNVGIGITDPQQKLDIGGNIRLTNGANRFIRLGSATNYGYDVGSDGDNFFIKDIENRTRLYITYPNGNVGIGTTSPIAKLHVAGDAAINNTTLGIRSGSSTYGGNLAGLNINSVAEIRSPQTSASPALTFHYEGLATRHITMNSGGVINVVSPSNENSGVATLAVNSNTVIHNGNLSNVTQLNSGSDFPNGTLVSTDIWYSDFSGDSFQIEIEGKSYGQVYPWMVRGQGYIYNNSIINQGFVDYTGNFGSLTAFNLFGYLYFWWPRQSYWNSFSVKVWSSNYYGGIRNRVTGISDSGIPGFRTREVGFPRLRVWNNSNLTFSLSGSTLTINAG